MCSNVLLRFGTLISLSPSLFDLKIFNLEIEKSPSITLPHPLVKPVRKQAYFSACISRSIWLFRTKILEASFTNSPPHAEMDLH